jgi:hypothetical protein
MRGGKRESLGRAWRAWGSWSKIRLPGKRRGRGVNIRCASCSAEIKLERDEAFIVCPFCNSSLYLDRAQTFRSFLLKPSVSATGAADRLAQELSRREIPPAPSKKIEGVWAPFWGVRGGALQETLPAFSPVPVALQGYRLPSADAVYFRDDLAEGFIALPCSESGSTKWEGREDVSSFALYRAPFYKLSFGAGDVAYVAWVDAVKGKVYMDKAPPPQSEAISSRFLGVLLVLFAVFTMVAAVVPGFGWSLLAVSALAVLVYPVIKRLAAEVAT